MDSSPKFCFINEEVEETREETEDIPNMLEIYVHHARNIHNVCIYADQDVYARFSLTCTPDDTITTNIVNGGGKNPIFNEKLIIKVPHIEAVLKCEIWMLSRARNYLEDQLLGFTLVPISSIASEDNKMLTREFTLSSTDLFHSPAGTVQLSLVLVASSDKHQDFEASKSSISSEVVILDVSEFNSIEFPDVNVANENQKMVSEYFSMDDYEMAVNSPPDCWPIKSSMSSALSDDRSSNDNVEKKVLESKPETLTSECEKESEMSKKENTGSVNKSSADEINFEEEQNAMQKRIVDMYMRSMQQFTESLAKMKLPMELDVASEDVVLNRRNIDETDKNKKDGSRVFYGSRAFF